MRDEEEHQRGSGDHGGRVDPVTLDRVGGRVARVVRDEPDQRGPADSTGCVPEEELPPRHAGDAGHPRRRVAEHRDEAAEEDDLVAVLLHQALGRREVTLREPAQRPPALEEVAAAPAADDHVAEVVAHDRPGGGDRDHQNDGVVPLRGENAEGDEGGLARQRDAERLDHHHHEEQRQTMAREEVRHGA